MGGIEVRGEGREGSLKRRRCGVLEARGRGRIRGVKLYKKSFELEESLGERRK